jgi:hypothetical protein
LVWASMHTNLRLRTPRAVTAVTGVRCAVARLSSTNLWEFCTLAAQAAVATMKSNARAM